MSCFVRDVTLELDELNPRIDGATIGGFVLVCPGLCMSLYTEVSRQGY